ncbi:MAG: cupredoxin domain-containing protein [Kofleriaceae bacterium]|nr:cupredoxin domain-containing protein [Kofleriaceae bacterium]
MSRFVLVVGLALSIVACSKDNKAQDRPTPATTAAGTVGADGVRRVAIEAGKEGYVPDKIPGKPGEKLVLVFTRTVEGECLAELKTPDGKVVELPMNKPVEVAITVPQTGKLTFACGMDMFQGAIVTDV